MTYKLSHLSVVFSKWMFPFFLVDDFAFCTRFFKYYSGTVSQEDKIETLKRSSRLIHYCAAPLLFHPDWRKLRSSYAPESSTVTPEETSSEDKKQETKERKTSKAQKTIDGECQRIVIRICESSYWVSFLFFGVTPPPPTLQKVGKQDWLALQQKIVHLGLATSFPHQLFVRSH